MMGGRVKDKVAIVTGGGSIGPGFGNGKASAIVYAREGAKVMVVDINLKAAEETTQIIEAEGGECIPFEADVTKPGDCNAFVERCVKTYKRIDILHNNVGIVRTGGRAGSWLNSEYLIYSRHKCSLRSDNLFSL
jgi:NAD(P)-dependent dehydrogenase (short-subunit alcohol dehydrogenase family)